MPIINVQVALVCSLFIMYTVVYINIGTLAFRKNYENLIAYMISFSLLIVISSRIVHCHKNMPAYAAEYKALPFNKNIW